MMLLIFDCDGVLVDSEVIAHAVMVDLVTELGRPMTLEESFGIFAGDHIIRFRRYAACDLGAERFGARFGFAARQANDRRHIDDAHRDHRLPDAGRRDRQNQQTE